MKNTAVVGVFYDSLYVFLSYVFSVRKTGVSKIGLTCIQQSMLALARFFGTIPTLLLSIDFIENTDGGLACGECDCCRLRREGFTKAGVADPTRYQ